MDVNLNHDQVLYNAACWFDKGFTEETSKKLMCSLGRVKSNGVWNDPFIEIMNF